MLALRRLRIFHEEAKQPLVVIKVRHGRVGQDLVPNMLSDRFKWICVNVSQLVEQMGQQGESSRVEGSLAETFGQIRLAGDVELRLSGRTHHAEQFDSILKDLHERDIDLG